MTTNLITRAKEIYQANRFNGWKTVDPWKAMEMALEEKQPISEGWEEADWEKNADKINDSLWYVDPNEVRQAIQQAREEVAREIDQVVVNKKLPIPNPYGTTVKVARYNQVMEEIRGEIRRRYLTKQNGEDPRPDKSQKLNGDWVMKGISNQPEEEA